MKKLRIPLQTSGFTPAYKKRSIFTSTSELLHSAVVVGQTPGSAISSGLGGRMPPPSLSLLWKAYLISGNLRLYRHGPRRIPVLRKSENYTRLDPTEKGAVSYFLGMTQAHLSAASVLGTPYSCHIDSLAKAFHLPLGKVSRPDLVTSNGSKTFVIEAKGRTHGFDRSVVESALRQLGKRPPVRSSAPLSTSWIPKVRGHVASLAYFDDNGDWSAWLEDPPPPQGLQVIDPPRANAAILAAHYEPIVSAIIEQRLESSSENFVEYKLNGGQIGELFVPRSIVQTFSDQEYEPGTSEKLISIGQELREVVKELGTENEGRPGKLMNDGILVRAGNAFLSDTPGEN